MLFEKIYPEFMEETQKEKMRKILEKVEVCGKILDIGSGPGFLEEFLPDAIAVDTDLENLKKVKGLKVLANGDFLPFKEKVFDTIFCIDTVHLIKNVSGIWKVLKKNGKIIVSVFCSKYNFIEKKEWLKERFDISELPNEKLQKEPSSQKFKNNISARTKDKFHKAKVCKNSKNSQKFKIEKEFLIKTEREWDFVLVVNLVS